MTENLSRALSSDASKRHLWRPLLVKRRTSICQQKQKKWAVFVIYVFYVFWVGENIKMTYSKQCEPATEWKEDDFLLIVIKQLKNSLKNEGWEYLLHSNIDVKSKYINLCHFDSLSCSEFRLGWFHDWHLTKSYSKASWMMENNSFKLFVIQT